MAKVGYFRLLNVEVWQNSEIIYEGMIDNAPDEIKQLDYTRGEMGETLKLYID